MEKVNSSSRVVLTSGDYLILLVEKIMQEASVFFSGYVEWNGLSGALDEVLFTFFWADFLMKRLSFCCFTASFPSTNHSKTKMCSLWFS